jgi:hypothetical protein
MQESVPTIRGAVRNATTDMMQTVPARRWEGYTSGFVRLPGAMLISRLPFKFERMIPAWNSCTWREVCNTSDTSNDAAMLGDGGLFTQAA